MISCQKSIDNIELKEYIIGDVNTVSINHNYIQSYYAGLFMAIEEINASGGVHNIPLKIENRGDYANHIESYIKAEELVRQKGAIILTGTSYPSTTLGVSRYAHDNQVPFLNTGSPSEAIITGNYASPFVFRIRSGYNTHIHTLAKEIIKNDSLKSLVVVTYNSTEGRRNSREIKNIISNQREDIVFARDINITSQNVSSSNVAHDILGSFTTGVVLLLDGVDINNTMKLIQMQRATVGKSVYLIMGGESEWVSSLLSLTPNDWVTTGFSWYMVETEENKLFIDKYGEKYEGLKPHHSSYIGYITGYLIADALNKARPTRNDEENRKKIAEHLKNTKFNSPIGLISMRKDHQTDMGIYVGILKPYNIPLNNGKVRPSVRIFDTQYIDVNDLLPLSDNIDQILDKIYTNNSRSNIVRDIPRKKLNVQ